MKKNSSRREFLKISSLITGSITVSPSFVRAKSKKKPNIIVVMADDISAKEFPSYKIPDPTYKDAPCSTPVINEMLKKGGVQFRYSWATPLCHPSRGLIMTGRYAYRTEWWSNGFGPEDYDTPLYDRHLTLGRLAKKSGYYSQMLGKWQLGGDSEGHAFDEYVLTPGKQAARAPLDKKPSSTGKGKPSYYWNPGYALINHPELKDEEKDNFKTTWKDFAPDIEMKYIKDFMNRSVKTDKPFFIYWPSHLGHSNWDFDNDQMDNPGVPAMDTKKYPETKNIDEKAPDGTIVKKTPPGMNYHVQYLDYQMGELIDHAKKLGIHDNFILLFSTDNATTPHGKGQKGVLKERGPYVPIIIYGPNFIKRKGEVDELSDLSDFMPTVAEWMDADCAAIAKEYKIPVKGNKYEFDGTSLVPFLQGKKKHHRDWIYSYNAEYQMCRTRNMLRDGVGIYWDTRGTRDQESYKQIKYPDASDLKKDIELIDKVINNYPIPKLAGENFDKYIKDKGSGLLRLYEIEVVKKLAKEAEIPALGWALIKFDSARYLEIGKKKDIKKAKTLYEEILEIDVKKAWHTHVKQIKVIQAYAKANLQRM